MESCILQTFVLSVVLLWVVKLSSETSGRLRYLSLDNVPFLRKQIVLERQKQTCPQLFSGGTILLKHVQESFPFNFSCSFYSLKAIMGNLLTLIPYLVHYAFSIDSKLSSRTKQMDEDFSLQQTAGNPFFLSLPSNSTNVSLWKKRALSLSDVMVCMKMSEKAHAQVFWDQVRVHFCQTDCWAAEWEVHQHHHLSNKMKLSVGKSKILVQVRWNLIQ